MKFLEKNIIQFFLASFLFFLLPIVQVQAAQYGCIDKNGVCRNVTAQNGIAGSTKCKEVHGEDARFIIDVCQPEKEFACFIGPNYCTNITANTFEGANFKCAPLCRSEAVNCYVDYGGSCPSTANSASPLSGVDDLKQDAARSLNKANLNTPEDLIRRAINLLMAFIGSITLVLYVVAGILWMTANGSSERVDKAKQILVWTTLGVSVMLFSYILVSFLFSVVPK